ncbi:hypothetical protein [Actinoplanes sp. M2I2]|uniref:hypothetical protein n=1 Tax=Actinoplanes sp. M2I2 TaxID=1734444 RepID=UPI0020212A22|nr:hypothetical protein [Actinoplanes sp. M2I2]
MTRLRAALVGSGALLMAYAVAGALTDPGVKPFGVVLFLAAVLVAHDAVWMPVVLAAGALLGRFVARRHRPVVRAAALMAASLLVVAVPLVVAVRPADNPSVLPLAYGRDLVLTLAALAAGTILVVAFRGLRSRKRTERTAGRDDR